MATVAGRGNRPSSSEQLRAWFEASRRRPAWKMRIPAFKAAGEWNILVWNGRLQRAGSTAKAAVFVRGETTAIRSTGDHRNARVMAFIAARSQREKGLKWRYPCDKVF